MKRHPTPETVFARAAQRNCARAAAVCAAMAAAMAAHGQTAAPDAGAAAAEQQAAPAAAKLLTTRSGVPVSPTRGAAGSPAAENQVPTRVPGTSTDPAVLAKTAAVAEAKGEATGLKLFPHTFSPLMPYLDSSIMFGSTCTSPGGLIESDGISSAAQSVKNVLAGAGLEYVLQQAYLLSASPDRQSGDAVLNAYSFRFLGDWKVVRDTDFNGWLTLGVNGGSGLGVNWQEQSPGDNIGSLSEPSGGWYGTNVWVDEAAWGMSFFGGKLAVVAGVVDQGNYFDANTFANSSFGQLMNTAFVNSSVLPLAGNNLALTVMVQPSDSFYVMAGAAATNQQQGHSPFESVSTQNMSGLLELGLIDANFCGLGRGVLRVQPFVSRYEGSTGGGVGVNVEQQLGASSPLGVFGRFGFAEKSIAAVGGARGQAATGIVAHGPFAKPGSSGAGSNDYLALGASWTRSAATDVDEFGVELTYAMQVTPTVILQPDVQMIADPANSTQHGAVWVFQLQVTVTW